MEFHVSFKLNEHIYLKDPESSELGKQIVKHGIDLIYELGFENFTFKKLAAAIKTTEATVYRYFENKHRLLLYILNWYWSYLDYIVNYQITNVAGTSEKLSLIIKLLTHELPASVGPLDYNKKYLNEIVIAESSKVYLVKEVNEINKGQVFKPYKELCATIATAITAYNPDYKFPRSLSSTLIEASHQQQFFMEHLPKLTDAGEGERETFAASFLTDLVFKTLNASK